MKQILLVLIILQTTLLSAHLGDRIDREILIQVTPENSNLAYLESLFPTTKITKCAELFQLWKIEFQGTPPMDYISQLKREGKINLYMRNRRLEPRATTPNDTFFPQQTFHLNNFNPGQSVPYGINSIGAWDYNKSGVTAKGDTIVVAVLDFGFDTAHEDISYSINYNEIPHDSIDNDGNGAIDDYRGWNAGQNNGILVGDDIPHGTKVLGGLAAKGNNKKGTCGVAWNTQIHLINVKAPNTNAGYEASLSAIEYCIKMKRLYRQTNKQKGKYIVALNHSLGIINNSPEDIPLWCQAIDSLGKEGIILSAAVENKNSDVESYQDMPILCNSPFQINVTNYNNTSLETDGGAYSKKFVHLAAPHNYYTTLPNNQYGNSRVGTSFSTPLVSGTIALMYSNFCDKFLDSLHARPEFYAKKIKEIILKNVDVTPGLTNKVMSNGKLNVFKTILKTVQLNDSFCKKDTIPNSILITGNNNSVRVYHAEKYIYVKKSNTIPLYLSLHNMLGQLILERRIENMDEKIDIHHLNPGFYILNYSLNQQIYTEKIVLD
jgi:hypothetical protein